MLLPALRTNPHRAKTKGKHRVSHFNLDEINHDCEGRRVFTQNIQLFVCFSPHTHPASFKKEKENLVPVGVQSESAA